MCHHVCESNDQDLVKVGDFTIRNKNIYRKGICINQSKVISYTNAFPEDGPLSYLEQIHHIHELLQHLTNEPLCEVVPGRVERDRLS